MKKPSEVYKVGDRLILHSLASSSQHGFPSFWTFQGPYTVLKVTDKTIKTDGTGDKQVYLAETIKVIPEVETILGTWKEHADWMKEMGQKLRESAERNF